MLFSRWLGVDQVFLRENGEEVPAGLQQKLQPMIDSGFLVLDFIPGPKHPLQNRWYNRCSKPDMAGAHSWVAFIDLDEFLVVLDKCVAPVIWLICKSGYPETYKFLMHEYIHRMTASHTGLIQF